MRLKSERRCGPQCVPGGRRGPLVARLFVLGLGVLGGVSHVQAQPVLSTATAATTATAPTTATTTAAAAEPAAPAAPGASTPAAWPMLPALVQGTQMGAGWRVVALPRQKPPMTRYAAETVAGRNALRIDAMASYGNLVHEPAVPGLPARLAWSWRVQQGNARADITSRSGDDLPARVCLSFDLPLAQVPFIERQLLRLARSRSGEQLPAATLCWVWGGSGVQGQLVDNAYTRRVRYIVLRTQDEPLDTWREENRDVLADFKRAFGDETTTVPPVVAVIVAGDADNTGAHSVAYVAGLRWVPAP